MTTIKPYFTISKQVVLQQYNTAKEVSDIVSYSYKTNPDISPILEQNTDCFFSIHTTNELKHIKDLSRVLFIAQAWNFDQIKVLIEQGIIHFVVDNEPDLDILTEYLKKTDQKINLMLRVKLKENTLRTEKYFVFGMSTKTVQKNIKKLKDNPNISSLGIHFHRKTQNMAEWNLTYELGQMFSETTFSAIDTINIGGGLPSDYANTNREVITSILKKLADLKQFLNSKDIKLMVEPGRFIAAPAGKLHTTITRIYDNNIIVNASVYNSDMDAIIVPVKLLVDGEKPKDEANADAYVIKGSTPCSLDLFRYRVYLDSPKEGDTLTFLNAGAYNFTSDFCDLEKLETKIID